MMPAVKMFDPIVGVDVHMVAIPSPAGPIPTPIPHPVVGMVFDPMDLVPLIGATVYVQGMPRATAGSAGKHVPHIPMGGPFLPPPPSNEGEIFMGSATVLMEDEPATYTALPVLSCNTFGAPPPPRAKKSPKPVLELPTSMVMAIPSGPPVLIGGPPTPSMMGLAQKLGMGLGGKLFQKYRKTKLSRKVSKYFHKKADKLMDKLGIPKKSRLREQVHDQVCSFTGHPVDIASGKVITDNVDFVLPGPIPFEWSRRWSSASGDTGVLGHGWHHSHDLALAYEDDVLMVRMDDGRPFIFKTLAPGEEQLDATEKIIVFRDANGYGVRRKESRVSWRFAATPDPQGLHRLAYQEDPEGNRIRYLYNGDGHLVGIVDSTGRNLRLETDAQGRIVRIRLPHPTQKDQAFTAVEYVYNEEGDLARIHDAKRNYWECRYDGHLLVSERFRDGLTFYFEYDRPGTTARCTRTWGDGGIYDHKLHYCYPDSATVVENSLGCKTTHHHQNGIVTRVIEPGGAETFTTLDAHNDPTLEIDALQRARQTAYDERGNPTQIKLPDGSGYKIEYNKDLPVKATDALGGTWSWEYDEHERLTKRTDPLGRSTCYTYEEKTLERITDPAGNETKFQWNAQGLLTSVTYPDGSSQSWERDLLGRVVAETDVAGNRREYELDLLGNVTSVKEPDGNTRRFEYDAEENVIHAVDRNHDVRFRYKGMGRMASRAENGTTVDFAYDTEENLLGIRNEHGSVYSFQLDGMGRVQAESGFDKLLRKYRRDKAGNVVRVERPGERYTEYQYDEMDRVIQLQHSDGSEESYAYRKDGELAEAKNADITLKFTRDELGMVVKEQQGEHCVEYKYDLLGWRSEMSSSLGAKQTIARNQMGDATAVDYQGKDASWKATFTRDIMGLEIERSLPGGVRSRWERDRLGRPLRHSITGNGSANGGPGGKARTKSYTWDPGYRLRQIEDSELGTTVYQHDPVGNLEGAVYGDFSAVFRSPDAIGNLFKDRSRTDRKYGPAGQLLESRNAQGVTTYEYDPEGNLIRKVAPGGKVWSYEWNAGGMLARVIRPDGEKVEFKYDPLGRRIAKTYKGKTTKWVWDGNVPLHEWTEEACVESVSGAKSVPDANADVIQDAHQAKIAPISAQGPPDAQGNAHDSQRHSHDAPRHSREGGNPSHPGVENKAFAGISDAKSAPKLTTWLFEPESFSPMAKIVDGQSYSIVTDHLGTPFEMYNSAGQRTWAAELDIYGAVRVVQEGNAVDCPFRYPGQYEDEETGLYYNRFRYYDPEAGGYVSQDPIGLAGGNPTLYGYVSDPNSELDTLGLKKDECSPKEAKNKVQKEQGPNEITRIDGPQQSVPNSQWHAHGKNGGAINKDGSLHDGDPKFSRKTIEWLRNYGWNV
jgi:RHS repeat-associated protein